METTEKGHQRRGSRTEKCVTFGETQVIPVDSYDRKGPWQQMAADRVRFQRRIKKTEQKISYVFEQSHRDKMRVHSKP